MDAPIEKITKNLIKSFEYLLSKGIPDGQIYKHYISFVKEFPFYFECDAIGNQIVFNPNGFIGPCHGFLGDKKESSFFFNPKNLKSDLIKNQLFRKWIESTAVFLNKCGSCTAIGICGGGCQYAKIKKSKGIRIPNKSFCTFIKLLLEYFLKTTIKIGGNNGGTFKIRS